MFTSYTAARKRALALIALAQSTPQLKMPMRVILITGEVMFIFGELALESGTKKLQQAMDRVQHFVNHRENNP